MASQLSVADLLSSPSRYDGRFVSIVGVAVIEFEHTALYASIELARGGTVEDGIWLDTDYKESHAFNERNVAVRGVFHAGPGGHMDLFAGEISPVQTLSVDGQLDEKRKNGRAR